MPRYTANPRAMDKELGGYIDVVNVNKKNSSNRKSSTDIALSLKKNLATTSISKNHASTRWDGCGQVGWAWSGSVTESLGIIVPSYHFIPEHR